MREGGKAERDRDDRYALRLRGGNRLSSPMLYLLSLGSPFSRPIFQIEESAESSTGLVDPLTGSVRASVPLARFHPPPCHLPSILRRALLFDPGTGKCAVAAAREGAALRAHVYRFTVKIVQ